MFTEQRKITNSPFGPDNNVGQVSSELRFMSDGRWKTEASAANNNVDRRVSYPAEHSITNERVVAI